MAKTMKQVLDDNYERAREERMKKAYKKAEFKANITIAIICTVLILVLLFGLFKMTTKAQEKCVKVGHTNCSELLE